MIPCTYRRFVATEQKLPLNILFGFNQKWMSMQQSGSVTIKPPNVVIVTQKPGNFPEWKSLLGKLLAKNTYVIYNLDRKEISKTHWTKNVALFVLDYVNDLDGKEKNNLDSFIQKGGSAFLHCCTYPVKGVNENGHSMSHLCQQECLFQDADHCQKFTGLVHPSLASLVDTAGCEALCHRESPNMPLISSKKLNSGNLVFSAVDILASLKLNEEENNSESNNSKIDALLKLVIEKLGLNCRQFDGLDPVELAPGYLFGHSEDVRMFVSSVQSTYKDQAKKDSCFTFRILSSEDEFKNPNATSQFFPIVFHDRDIASQTIKQHFNVENYLKHLKTNKTGRVAIFSKTVTSTQFLVERITSSLPSFSDGLVIIAGQQLQGKGRGGNTWLSPDGCMMFSLALSIKISSEIGRRLPYLQHIAAVAMVNSVREIPGYEELNIGIKWPNDIYFGHSVKIGGLIVNSSVNGGEFRTIIGIGVNISNRKPTICLNSIIDQYNSQYGKTLRHLSIEEIIARTLTNIEKLLQVFECSGHMEFCKMYYKYWIHGDQEIRLGDDDGEHVVIKGLDDNGFLLVQKRTGENISVQPDGNSFDMLKGLISVKRH